MFSLNRRSPSSSATSLDAARARTNAEIDELYLEYLARINVDGAASVGAAYARYSTRHQESAADQIRKILDRAVQLNVYTPRENIFFDVAISGRKKRRPGFAQLEELLSSRKVQTVLFFSTSRLYRKTYRSLEFADRVHNDWGHRIVFVAQNIDTDNGEQWQFFFQWHAMMDQFVVTTHVSAIRAAQEGLFEKRFVFGTISYGYSGEIIPGEFSPKGKPRRRLVIDAATAAVVRRIFHLFVHERQPLNEIARILNGDPSVPLPARCWAGRWTNDTVRRVLTNSRYRGLWQYGVTESIYKTDADYVGKRIRIQPLKEAQIEELRIISDDEWFAAAKLIAGHGRAGRKAKDGDRTTRPDVLNGLFFCVGHERPLVVCGGFGSHMGCPVCMCLPIHERCLLSWLNRRTAVKLLCKELARRILDDEELVKKTVEYFRCAAENDDRNVPEKHIASLKAKRVQLESRIEYAIRNVGHTAEDKAATTRIINDLRAEKSQIVAELHRATAARTKRTKIPTPAEVRDLLRQLAQLLIDGSLSDDPAQRAAVRILIEELTGGKIFVTQQGERKRQHGWLRGTFQLRLLDAVVRRLSDVPVAEEGDAAEIVIDFKRPLSIDAKAEIAWQMNQANKRHSEIGQKLGCVGSYVTRLIKHYAKTHGIEWVDGRSFPKNFPDRYKTPAVFKKIAEQVMVLYAEGLLLGQIAQRLKVHVVTVRNAVKWWHAERGLPVPNGRTRAGELRIGKKRTSD